MLIRFTLANSFASSRLRSFPFLVCLGKQCFRFGRGGDGRGGDRRCDDRRGGDGRGDDRRGGDRRGGDIRGGDIRGGDRRGGDRRGGEAAAAFVGDGIETGVLQFL